MTPKLVGQIHESRSIDVPLVDKSKQDLNRAFVIVLILSIDPEHGDTNDGFDGCCVKFRMTDE